MTSVYVDEMVHILGVLLLLQREFLVAKFLHIVFAVGFQPSQLNSNGLLIIFLSMSQNDTHKINNLYVLN